MKHCLYRPVSGRVKDLVLSLNQCPNLALEQKMKLPLVLVPALQPFKQLRLMNMPRWLAARHLKRQRGDALQSWVSIKDAALQVFFMSGWHWSVCKVWAARTASSHGWKGVAWCSTQLAFYSQSADQVAPAQPSVLGRSDDDSSGVSTCFLMPLVRDLCTSQPLR